MITRYTKKQLEQLVEVANNELYLHGLDYVFVVNKDICGCRVNRLMFPGYGQEEIYFKRGTARWAAQEFLEYLDKLLCDKKITMNEKARIENFAIMQGVWSVIARS